MSYSVQNIRNVCLVGHSGNGKTALAESLLFMTGAINRMGNSADGNTVCDYDPEEIRRQISISTAVAPLEYKGCKINLLDTPGAFDFSGEVMEALRAADAAILVEAGAAAEAALREKAQREAAVASTRTHAADDDSASIDDENIENSQTIGLAAVLEILGGRVIEEKMTEGGY